MNIYGPKPELENKVETFFRRVRSALRLVAKSNTSQQEGVKFSDVNKLPKAVQDKLRRESYEFSECKLLKRYLSREAKVVEFGSGMGFLSTYCAKRLGGERVVTFEPNPNMWGVIRDLHRLNKVNPTLVEGGVAKEAGERVLNLSDEFWAASTDNKIGGEQVSCQFYAFHDALAKYEPTTLIIDIEGGELELVGEVIPEQVELVVIELHEAIIGKSGCVQVREWLYSSGLYPVADYGDRGVVAFVRNTLG